MLKRLVLPCLLLCAFSVSAQVYKWVDEDGVVHYSDQPAPGAERIDLPGRPTSAPRAPTPAAAVSPPASTANSNTATPFSYVDLSVTSPAAEETLWNIGGTLTVNLGLRPALRSGDRVRLYFDGEPLDPQLSLTFDLEEVWRGEHNLQAEVFDANGKVMIRSEPMRFYVQQTSIVSP